MSSGVQKLYSSFFFLVGGTYAFMTAREELIQI